MDSTKSQGGTTSCGKRDHSRLKKVARLRNISQITHSYIQQVGICFSSVVLSAQGCGSNTCRHFFDVLTLEAVICHCCGIILLVTKVIPVHCGKRPYKEINARMCEPLEPSWRLMPPASRLQMFMSSGTLSSVSYLSGQNKPHLWGT